MVVATGQSANIPGRSGTLRVTKPMETWSTRCNCMRSVLTFVCAVRQFCCVEDTHCGERLDRFFADRFPEVSRSRFSQLIGDYAVLVNDHNVKPTYEPKAGDHIAIIWPEPTASEVLPQDIPLDILHEDEGLL